MITASAGGSAWSKWAVVVAVLAFLIPFAILIIRRMVREQFRDRGINCMMPPTGPDVGGV